MPHSLLYSIARVSGLGAITVLIAVSFAGAETPSTYKDPAEYCKAVGTIDAPDSRYTGPKTPDWMTTVFYTPDQIAEQKSACCRSNHGRRLALRGRGRPCLRPSEQPPLRQGRHEQDADSGNERFLRQEPEHGDNPAFRHRPRESDDLSVGLSRQGAVHHTTDPPGRRARLSRRALAAGDTLGAWNRHTPVPSRQRSTSSTLPRWICARIEQKTCHQEARGV